MSQNGIRVSVAEPAMYDLKHITPATRPYVLIVSVAEPAMYDLKPIEIKTILTRPHGFSC